MSSPPVPDSGDASAGYTLPAQPLIERNLAHVLALPALPAVDDLRRLLTSSVPRQQFGDDGAGDSTIAAGVASLFQCAPSTAPLSERIEAVGELTRALSLSLASPFDSGSSSRAPDAGRTPAHLTAVWRNEVLPQTDHRLLLASCRVALAYAPQPSTDAQARTTTGTPPEALRKAQAELQSARTTLLAFLRRIPRTRPSVAASHEDTLYASLAQQSHGAHARLLLALSNVTHWLDLEARASTTPERNLSQEVRRLLSYRDKAIESAKRCSEVAGKVSGG